MLNLKNGARKPYSAYKVHEANAVAYDVMP